MLNKSNMSENDKLEKIAKMAAEHAIKKQLQNTERKRSRWLHNTKKLMEKYNILKEHSEKAIKNIIDTDLEKCLFSDISEDNAAELEIDSIERSELRTYIIVKHISAMLNVLQEIYNRKHQQRKYRALIGRYIKQNEYNQIAQIENIDERTVYRDINDALKDLSILIFGIDGMVE